MAATALLNPICIYWHVLWIGHSSRHHGDHKDPPHRCCQEFTAGMGKLDVAHRHGFQAALGSRAASGMSRVLGNQLGEDLSVPWTSPWTSVLPLLQERTGVNHLSSGSQASIPLAMQELGSGFGPSFWEAGWWEAEEVAQAT